VIDSASALLSRCLHSLSSSASAGLSGLDSATQMEKIVITRTHLPAYQAALSVPPFTNTPYPGLGACPRRPADWCRLQRHHPPRMPARAFAVETPSTLAGGRKGELKHGLYQQAKPVKTHSLPAISERTNSDRQLASLFLPPGQARRLGSSRAKTKRCGRRSAGEGTWKALDWIFLCAFERSVHRPIARSIGRSVGRSVDTTDPVVDAIQGGSYNGHTSIPAGRG
jgi:hypothetical protein